MRYLLLVPILMACQSAPKPIVTPPVEIPTDLIQLETNPKPATFLVARGENKTLTVSSKLLSPAVKKIKISVSGSSGVEVNPKDITLTGNSSTDLTVTVPVEAATNDKPYFYVNGQALDNNNNPVVSNGVTIKFQWTVPAPPAAP